MAEGRMSQRVGIVGLGVMGGALARNFLAARVEVVGFDIDAHRLSALAEAGIHPAPSPAELARLADVVLLLLPSTAALEAVVAGPDGLATAARRGLIVLEMSTLPLDDKENARRVLEAAGATVLDCPISGTGVQARTGDIAIYGSGDAAAFERCRPLLAKVSREAVHLGPFGVGSKMKFAANLLVAIHIAAAGEGLALIRKAGLDPAQAVRVLGAGAGSSRMLEVRGPMMAARRYTPASMSVRLFQKDLRIIGEFAASVGSPVPMLAAASALFASALTDGYGELDTAAVHEVLAGQAQPLADAAQPGPER